MSALYHRGSETTFADEPGLIYFWGRRNFTSTEDRAIGFAYTFMGSRIQCAQCHKHPFDVWTQEDFQQFEQFFTRVRYNRNGSDRDTYQAMLKELGVEGQNGNQQRRAIADAIREGKTVPFPDITINRANNNRRPRGNNNRDDARNMARLLGSEEVDLAEIRDPRTALMDWLRHDEKQLFARAFVNRVWANYFNRGIVEPTDDLSLANPPCNAELLDHLAAGFVAHDFDMHWVHREICNSATYQRSWRPNAERGDERNFSRAVPRRLPAEVAYDAVTLATAPNSRAATFATDLSGRMLTRPGVPRNGRGNSPDYALAVFGRSTRENNCDCDRSAEASLLQTVFLRNDQETLTMIGRDAGWVMQMTEELTGQQSGRRRNGRDNNRGDDSVADLQRRVDRAETALRTARRGEDQDAIAQAERTLSRAEARLKDARGTADDAPVEAPAAGLAQAADVPGVVDEAYLRTVSRFPSEAEREIAAAFIRESDDPVAGLRDLVWTLINTKEFIVNH